MHPEAPAVLKFPTPQVPEQAGVLRLVVAPNLPAAHRVHVSAPPASVKEPTGHTVPLAAVAPAEQNRPGTATQGPEQLALETFAATPKRPAGQMVQEVALASLNLPAGQVALGADRQQVAQKEPAGQGRHAPTRPDGEYVPGSQLAPEICVAPRGQYLPATGTHAPLQEDVFRAELLP